jgi:hypothetical protein
MPRTGFCFRQGRSFLDFEELLVKVATCVEPQAAEDEDIKLYIINRDIIMLLFLTFPTASPSHNVM